MFTDVKNILFHSSRCISSKCFVGITETKADSSFLFHHFLSYFLKEGSGVMLLSFCQSFNHFNNVGNKIGNNLLQAKDQGRFRFIEGLKFLAQAVNPGLGKGDNPWGPCINSNGQFSVQQFYSVLKDYFEKFKTETNTKIVFIIDNVSVLHDISVESKDIVALLHYLNFYVTTELGGTLIVGLNSDGCEQDENTDQLKRWLHHSVDMCIDVKGLETGYCKDVHGQLTVSWYDRAARQKPLVKEAQFKLTDKTCAVFAAGMSSAVL